MADPVQHGSLEQPIKVLETRYDKGQYVKWEYAYIDQHTTFYKRLKQALHKPAPGVYLDEVHVREANGTVNVFWFDISDQFNAELKALEATAKAMGLR